MTKGIAMFGTDEPGDVVRLGAAVLIILWVSAVASAFIDNIPYTATMIPVVLQIANDLNIELGPMIWALAFSAPVWAAMEHSLAHRQTLLLPVCQKRRVTRFRSMNSLRLVSRL